MKTSYPQELIDLAKESGYKAANLQFLDQILLEFNELQGDGIEIQVPKHISISNQKIISHLNKYAPLWQDKWQEFTEAQGDSAENLNPLAIDKLHEIQEMIQVAFNDKSHEFIVEGMEEGKKQMVRSTGDEDRVDVANPGGNESVPSDGDKISSSIGAVISSYFSEKSMSQRLKSGEEITKNPPLMPCLIQELVGETSKDNLPPVSGIIYTDSKNVRVQAAYGHGELVVNSKGNFDNFFVTNEDVVHQYIGDKKVRIVPVVNQAEKKMELEEIENTEFAQNPSLSEEQSMRLAKFSKFVQSKYGMRMDIEFVYDPNSNKINIVQARPIPEGKRRGMAPSALSNDFISQEKPQHIDGEVITPDVMVAKKITSKEEVIVCKNIDQALTSYLKNQDNKIKVVIIDKTAPDTSHEAGFFTSQAIPVIYANDYDAAEAWVQNLEENVLVIDPQHGSIYQIDKEQYQDTLIEEGIFRSSLAEHVTPIKRAFMQGPSNEFPVVKANTIGELVIEARNNPDASQKLFRYIHDEIGPRETKLYGKQEIKDDLKSLLTFPSSDEEFTKQKETLANLLNFVSSIKNEKEIASSTYEQLIITGVELYKEMKEVEANPQSQETKLNYLNIHQKFNGLISSKGKTGILSTSLFNEIAKHDQREILKTEVQEAGFSLSNIDEDKFLKLAQHKKHLINDEDHQKWLSFCHKECQAPETSEKLEALVNDIVKLDLKDYWLNVNFLDAYEKDSDKVLANLEQEYEQNLAASADILKASKLIDRMEHQIGQWAEPKNFKKLFEKELQPKIQEITNLIKLDEENKLSSNLAIKQLYRMVDAIDLSIKQLQNSPLYEDKEAQVQNFRMMLGEFFQVMENQVGDIHPERIEAMKEFFNEKSASNKPNELLPSSDFSVIKSDFFQDDDVGFLRGFLDVENKNLADLYTLVHQTLLNSIGRKSAATNKYLMNSLPDFVKRINDKALGDRSETFGSYHGGVILRDKLSFLYSDLNYPNINMHYKIPLRTHSGTLKLEYNIINKKIKLDYMLFGMAEGERWKELEKTSFILLEAFTDTKLIEHRADDHMLNLQIEITEDTKNLKDFFEIINTIYTESNVSGPNFEALLKSYNNDFQNKLEDYGLSSVIFNAYQDNHGNLDFKALKKIIEAYKNDSSLELKSIQEKDALMRLMAMDNNGVVNYRKLEEINNNYKYHDLNLVAIINKDTPKRSIYSNIIFASQLIEQKADIEIILKVSKLITTSNEVINTTLKIDRILQEIGLALIEKDYPIEAVKIAEKMTDKDTLRLWSIAMKLIEKNHPIEAVKIAEKIMDKYDLSPKDEYYLDSIAIKLIEKNHPIEAVKIAEKITAEYHLISIVNELIEKDHLIEAIKIVEKFTAEYRLISIVNELIEKDYPIEATKVAEKITDQDTLQSIVKKLIEKDHPTEATKVAEKITDQDTLQSILKILIEKDHPTEAAKVAEKITYQDTLMPIVEKYDPTEAIKIAEKTTDQRYLEIIVEELIEKDYPTEAIKITEKITDQDALQSIAIKLIEKDYPIETVKITSKIIDNRFLKKIVRKLKRGEHIDEAAKLADLIPIPMDLREAHLEAIDQGSSYTNQDKSKDSSWFTLPVAEAIDESSYRKLDNDYAITEAEKLDHLKSKAKDNHHSAPMDYQSFIDQYNPQGKLPEGNIPKTPNSEDFKLPETDMSAVAVIAARGAKFFANKLTASRKKEPQRKKVKKQKKDKGRIR